MKIGIIGSGNIGSTVGTLWVKAGHQVMFSSRNPGNLKQLVDGLGPLARAGTVAEALAYGDAIFVGVPYGAMPQLGKDYAKEFSGKIVIDAGNAVVARDGEIGKAAREAGVALTSAKLLAGARIVRAFNTINFRRLANLSNRAEGRIANSHGRRRSRSAEDRLHARARRRIRSGRAWRARTLEIVRARRTAIRTRNFRAGDARTGKSAEVKLR